jgi:hypothetical protein
MFKLLALALVALTHAKFDDADNSPEPGPQFHTGDIDSFSTTSQQALAATLKSRKLKQIPGPVPIIRPGRQTVQGPFSKTKWDATEMEMAGGVFHFLDTYYLYYHGLGKGVGYQCGLATATNPLGPWTTSNTPILPLGPKGSWDDQDTASCTIVRKNSTHYVLYYEGVGTGKDGNWWVGIAYGTSPRGPWVKSTQNPILPASAAGGGGFYMGSVVQFNNSYRMYVEAPIIFRDQGPMAIFTAPEPEGPYTKGPKVMVGQSYGGWDAEGYSEAGISYHDGVWHMMMSGAAGKWDQFGDDDRDFPPTDSSEDQDPPSSYTSTDGTKLYRPDQLRFKERRALRLTLAATHQHHPEYMRKLHQKRRAARKTKKADAKTTAAAAHAHVNTMATATATSTTTTAATNATTATTTTTIATTASSRRRLGDDYEQIGYAFSFDGIHFVRYYSRNNPNTHISYYPHIMKQLRLFASSTGPCIIRLERWM